MRMGIAMLIMKNSAGLFAGDVLGLKNEQLPKMRKRANSFFLLCGMERNEKLYKG